MVGPLPRQAEDRHVHAAREDPERDPQRRAKLRAIGEVVEPLRPRRRRADDAAVHPAALARARGAARRLRRPRGRRHHERRRLRRHRAQHHRLPGLRARRATSCSTPRRSSTRRPTSSTATPTGRTCRASTSTRSRAAPTAATRRRSTASRSSASSTTAARATRCSSAAGSSSVPRIARDMGVFVPKEQANEILGAITIVWSEDLKYRMSRVKARLKFMVDDIGAEGMLERVEAKLGRTLERLRAAADRRRSRPRTSACTRRSRTGLSYIGVAGAARAQLGDQLIAVADLVESLRRRHPPHAPAEPHRHRRARRRASTRSWPASTRSAFRSRRTRSGPTRSPAPASRTATSRSARRRTRLRALVDASRGARSATRSRELRLHLDGCPHACAQHWVGDLGFQATTGKDADGKRSRPTTSSCAARSARRREVGRSLFRRVASEQLEPAVEGLVRGWLDSARRRRDVHGTSSAV